LETPDTRTHTYTHKHTRTRTRAHANTRAIPGSASNLGDCARFLGGGAYSWCCCGCCWCCDSCSWGMVSTLLVCTYCAT
jgi:hypothetical protein